MTTPDRTDELVRAMLERRASRPMPEWLMDRTMHAIVMAPQARNSRWAFRPPSSSGARLAMVAALVLLLTILAAGALLAAGIVRLPAPPASSNPALIVVPSASPSGVPSDAASPVVTPEVVLTPRPVPPPLAVDSLAAVTAAGDGLRVRSAPGVGADSKKLTPLLPKGTRILVVRGPVEADGMDWYEVSAENDAGLFGWVASGKNGETWIKPVDPKCTDSLDEMALWTVRPMDFLVCYGDAPVTLQATMAFEMDTENVDEPCPWTGARTACSPEPVWLWDRRPFTYSPDGRTEVGGVAAFAPGVSDEIPQGPPVLPVTMTIAMDAPEAVDCRLVNGNGHDVMPRDEAITGCRLTFVVRQMSWDPINVLPGVPSIATVVLDSLPVSTYIGEPPAGPALQRGDRVLVAEGMDWEGSVAWYGVAPADGSAGPGGWVPMTNADGQPTMEAVPIDCPAKTDWAAIEALPPGDRLVCFGSDEFTLDLQVVQQEAADPDRGLCGAYRASTPTPHPCVALPGWLTTYSGVVGTDPARPGAGIELRFDPRQVERDWFPTTPAVRRVTGSFANDASTDCAVRNPETGDSLVNVLTVMSACQEVFVVTEVGGAP